MLPICTFGQDMGLGVNGPEFLAAVILEFQKGCGQVMIPIAAKLWVKLHSDHRIAQRSELFNRHFKDIA
jgi:hypothetical protein